MIDWPIGDNVMIEIKNEEKNQLLRYIDIENW